MKVLSQGTTMKQRGHSIELPGVGTKFECLVPGNSINFAPARAATDTGIIPIT